MTQTAEQLYHQTLPPDPIDVRPFPATVFTALRAAKDVAGMMLTIDAGELEAAIAEVDRYLATEPVRNPLAFRMEGPAIRRSGEVLRMLRSFQLGIVELAG